MLVDVSSANALLVILYVKSGLYEIRINRKENVLATLNHLINTLRKKVTKRVMG